MQTTTSLNLCVGRRVHCILYGGRDGIVFAIHGTPRPESVKPMGAGMVTGGNAYCDVVWDDGTINYKVPEAIIYGIQWSIHDGVATADEILDALAFAKTEEARRKAEAKAEADRQAEQRAKFATEHPELVKRSDRPNWSPGRLAATNIRIELKKAFKGVKFSVKSDYSSVNIEWVDGPTNKEVDAVVKKYQDSSWGDVFGGPKYVFAQRCESLEGIKAAWVKAGRDVAEVPDDYIEGGRWKMANQTVAEQIRQTWSKTSL